MVEAAPGEKVGRELHDHWDGIIRRGLALCAQQHLRDLTNGHAAELDRGADVEPADGVVEIGEGGRLGTGEGAGTEENKGGEKEHDAASDEGAD